MRRGVLIDLFQFPPPRGGERAVYAGGDPRPLDFNSRPREGANCLCWLKLSITLYFNSRPREGANTGQSAYALSAYIFQFPPPRGGERSRPRPRRRSADFNSRPREGANHAAVDAVEKLAISIPAPARGRTSARRQSEPHGEYFNSRPREGANLLALLVDQRLDGFQFPPPRGGERRPAPKVSGSVIFQFPPPRGGERPAPASSS